MTIVKKGKRNVKQVYTSNIYIFERPDQVSDIFY